MVEQQVLTSLNNNSAYVYEIPDDVFEELTFIESLRETSPQQPFLFPEDKVDSEKWFVEENLIEITNKRRSLKLHEFFRLILNKPKYRDYVTYMDRDKGIFKILKPKKVAEKWKQAKGRITSHEMTYEKLARALRLYYRSGEMLQTPGKYQFRFGPKSGFGTVWLPKQFT
ncbi:unnamed protein product [Didymodactylos carnosus]|uniref:ETS domain-containing protein n=1 Tax=Didymodactylos carnosus TaxID=1234261 RepID=A0A814I1L5_9BILA|nr:unnamed protein product [Didymodactylos carnosus]CAF1460240.1 unnamed protein product [Didymodactylos carnosus]CAF3788988.1 unnamed protein product [Didymodactylos carnosus]CAF4253597.1 unnamed protein product [Didymodactylos carnosus]